VLRSLGVLRYFGSGTLLLLKKYTKKYTKIPVGGNMVENFKKSKLEFPPRNCSANFRDGCGYFYASPKIDFETI